MAFQPGNKLAKGRPKGSRSKRTLAFIEVLEDHGFCPVTAMIECYREAKKTYDNYGTIYDAISRARSINNSNTGDYSAPLTDEAHKYLKIAGDMAKDIASYTYPKLKSIEQSKPSPLEGLTQTDQIKFLKQALNLLEQQAGTIEPGAT